MLWAIVVKFRAGPFVERRISALEIDPLLFRQHFPGFDLLVAFNARGTQPQSGK